MMLLTIIWKLEQLREVSTTFYSKVTKQGSLYSSSPFKSAGNATLGFHKIVYINLDHRHDLDDVMTLQSTISNITLERFSAIDSTTLRDVGLPPTSLKPGEELKKTQQACFRSHATLWRKVLDENLGSLLIMEADATWDINVRKTTVRIAEALNELMTRYPNSSTSVHGSHTYTPESLVATENDPYSAGNWDVLFLGQCFQDGKNEDEYLIFSDPDGPIDSWYADQEMHSQRAVRRIGGIVCTNAYAVSPQGAFKLLLRGTLDLNTPVDLLIGQFILQDYISGYSLVPPIFGQWEYKDGIGVDNHNSEIDDHDITLAEGEELDNLWRNIYDTADVWQMKPFFRYINLKTPVLAELGKHAFGLEIKGDQ